MGITGGAGQNDFVKYPKTTHLWGSKIADKDKMLSEKATRDLLKKNNLNFVWESKLDGSNVAISFPAGEMRVQNRGHVIGHGEHPQYHVFLAWANTFADKFREILGSRFIMFGEWCYAVHAIKYTSLPHFFNEFDVYDTESGVFLSTPRRTEMLGGLASRGFLAQVPVVHPSAESKNWVERSGKLTLEEARKLAYEHGPMYGEAKPEGLYLKVERGDEVVERYKLVRDEFIQKIIDDNVHWRSRPVEVQGLADGVDIFSPRE